MIVLVLIMTLISGITARAARDTILIGEPDWPGIWAKDALVKEILTTLGYNVELRAINDTLIHKTIAEGQLDLHFGSWMPATEPVRKEIEGEYELVTRNLDNALYTLGVPEYAWEAGVKSFADLDKYADRFDHKIYMGPVGWPISEAIENAVEDDIYGLGDWQVINSSITAMVANMKRAHQRKEWIVSLAWKPHWMNYVMDIKYLKDPKNVWLGAESYVDTLSRMGFKEDYPQVYKFAKQFKVNNKMANKWIYDIGYKKIKPEEVAQEWIKNNLEVVKEWVKGVKAKDGQDAFQVLKANY